MRTAGDWSRRRAAKALGVALLKRPPVMDALRLVSMHAELSDLDALTTLTMHQSCTKQQGRQAAGQPTS